jgi:putative membrane protein
MSNAAPVPAPSRVSDRAFFIFTGVVSTAALAFLAWILVIRRGGPVAGVDLRFLPAVNASLNATAAALLISGWVAVKRGAKRVHQYLMVAAFVASSLFLVCYLAYHYVHGDTRYVGDFRALYLALLASHVLLSMPVVPLALVAFYFAWRKQFTRHRKVTRWLAPIWVYVSVTGVVVYFMLRGSLPAVY